jgi:esterase/lipase superfamily enzyme
MGLYDIPAIIDYVLIKNKNYKKVAYMGHSMGNNIIIYGMTQKLHYY